MEVIYTNIWRRFWAEVVDAFIFMFFVGVMWGVYISFLQHYSLVDRGGLLGKVEVFLLIAPVVIKLLYEVVAIRLYGKTFGKHLMKILVVRSDGSYLSWERAIVRALSKNLSFYFYLMGGISAIIAIFSKSRQSIHDVLVDSYVIRKQ